MHDVSTIRYDTSIRWKWRNLLS